jgi:hypothetical protein
MDCTCAVKLICVAELQTPPLVYSHHHCCSHIHRLRYLERQLGLPAWPSFKFISITQCVEAIEHACQTVKGLKGHAHLSPRELGSSLFVTALKLSMHPVKLASENMADE